MSAIIQPSGLSRGSTLSGPPRPREVRLGWPGFDPQRDCLDIPIFDDSGSMSCAGGNDPVGNRYAEARRAVRALSTWTRASHQRVALLHFDHPAIETVGPHRLDRPRERQAVLNALHLPENVWGSSSLTPAMMAANKLARESGIEDVRCTIFSDFELTDLNRQQPYEEIAKFPGRVHAVVLNADAPAALRTLRNVTVTRVDGSSPPGLVAAALMHSLAATRRGAGLPRIKQVRPRSSRSSSYFSRQQRPEH